MRILYGLEGKKQIDITSQCDLKLRKGKYIVIPANDIIRKHFFTDPLPGILKQIYIEKNGNTTVHNDKKTIYINRFSHDVYENSPTDYLSTTNVKKYTEIKSKITLLHGSFKQELRDQKLSAIILTGGEKILQLGGHIGIHTIFLAHLMKNDSDLLVLESNHEVVEQMKQNRDGNNLHFHIEEAVLSKRPQFQKGWNRIQCDSPLPDYKPVATIDFKTIAERYNILFDTLVLDSENYLDTIFVDMPEIIENIETVFLKNDYIDSEKHRKNLVNNFLLKNGFELYYIELGGFGPLRMTFFEVWKLTEKVGMPALTDNILSTA
jgi:hypothetical protein